MVFDRSRGQSGVRSYRVCRRWKTPPARTCTGNPRNLVWARFTTPPIVVVMQTSIPANANGMLRCFVCRQAFDFETHEVAVVLRHVAYGYDFVHVGRCGSTNQAARSFRRPGAGCAGYRLRFTLVCPPHDHLDGVAVGVGNPSCA
jgi:hypothetical protein